MITDTRTELRAYHIGNERTAVNVPGGCNTAHCQQKHPAVRCGLRTAQSDDDDDANANAKANTMLCYEQFMTVVYLCGLG